MAALHPPPTKRARDVERFVLALDRRLETVDRAILVADWDLQSGRSTEGTARWQGKRAALLSDPGLLDWVRSAREGRAPFLIRRRLELLERILLDTRVEQHPEVVRRRSELQQRIVSFRPRWKGRRVNRAVIWQVSRTSPRAADRRAAYYALEPLYRPLEEALQQLIAVRNERARALGFRTFAEMRLGFQGLTPERLAELVTTAARTARPRIRELRESFEDATGQRGWHPWDLNFARHRRVPLPDRLFPRRAMLPRVLDAVGQWGFRVERMRFRVVFHDLPSGGLTLAPDPPKDVRILVHPQGGWLPYSVMFHEVGHAVHSASIRAPRHLLRWHENIPGFGAFHEGIGGLFELIPSRVEWLSAQPGVGRRRAEAFAARARDASLLDAGWLAGWIRIEQELYRRPDRDPMPGIARFEREVFGYDAYPTTSFVDSFFVDDPTYCANYLLAILFGRQLTRELRTLFGEPVWPNARVGPWLTEHWFAPGSLYDWIPRIQEITGRPFGADALREDDARP